VTVSAGALAPAAARTCFARHDPGTRCTWLHACSVY
jgi:hypothetical protein